MPNNWGTALWKRSGQDGLFLRQHFGDDMAAVAQHQKDYPGLRVPRDFKASGSGADGKTVSDLAPGTFDGAYAGKQQESKPKGENEIGEQKSKPKGGAGSRERGIGDEAAASLFSRDEMLEFGA